VEVVRAVHDARGVVDRPVLTRDHPRDPSDDGPDGALVSIRWTDIAGAMVIRLRGRVAPLADALAVGVATVVVDAPVILDVRHVEVAAPDDVAVALRLVTGTPLPLGRVCVVASTPGTQFGLAVFKTVGDALQAWCFGDSGYGSGWR
jgi:hypothetical protein